MLVTVPYILTSSNSQIVDLKKKKQDEFTYRFSLLCNIVINSVLLIEILNLKTFYLMMITTSNLLILASQQRFQMKRKLKYFVELLLTWLLRLLKRKNTQVLLPTFGLVESYSMLSFVEIFLIKDRLMKNYMQEYVHAHLDFLII